MTKLYLFNPECDIARGAASDSYTPPSNIQAMRRRLSLTPATYAERNSAILLNDDMDEEELRLLPYYDIVSAKNLSIVNPSKLNIFLRNNECKPVPWGWERSVANYLTRKGVDKRFIPTAEQLTRIRMESSRIKTIDFFTEYGDSFPGIVSPICFDSTEKAIEFWNDDNDVWFKSPWSSSGRGNLLASEMKVGILRPWISGVIKNQGYVIAEKNYHKILDFASLWMIKGGKAEFLGFSVFEADSRGRYHGNIIGSQPYLKSLISDKCGWNDDILEMQKEFIESPEHITIDGPVGFDMLVTSGGNINPCVEINRRYTMGIVALYEELFKTTSNRVRKN